MNNFDNLGRTNLSFSYVGRVNFFSVLKMENRQNLSKMLTTRQVWQWADTVGLNSRGWVEYNNNIILSLKSGNSRGVGVGNILSDTNTTKGCSCTLDSAK